MGNSVKVNRQRLQHLKDYGYIVGMTEIVSEAIASNKLVLFIGAGLSMNLGLPSWSELVEKLCGYVTLSDEEKDSITLLKECGLNSEALNRIAKYSGKTIDELRNLLPKILKNAPNDKISIEEESKAYRCLSELYKLGARKIVTTNYDNTLEQCLGISAVTPRSFKGNPDFVSNSEEYLLKLHGGIKENEIEETVLFEDDYRKKYVLDENIPNLLQELFTHNVVLFIGCSLLDKYMDIYEKLRVNNAVQRSYVICLDEDHLSVKGEKLIQRLTIESYSQLGDILELLLLATQKAQQKKCKAILFKALPLESYNYSTARQFFGRVSGSDVTACYFFNTQVRFSEWFSPSLHLHLCQQMGAYNSHQKESGFNHYRILFLPFDNKSLFRQLNKEETKHDIKATYMVHKFMNCRLAFITTDVFKTIIESNQEFFFNDETGSLEQLGIADITSLSKKKFSSDDLAVILETMNYNGYMKTNDLDFAVVKADSESEIWQANYDDQAKDAPFKYSIIEEPKKAAYKSFSEIIIRYWEEHDELTDPCNSKGKRLSDYFLE